MWTHGPFDFATTFVKLDGDDSGDTIEVDSAFWDGIDSRPGFQHGRLADLGDPLGRAGTGHADHGGR